MADDGGVEVVLPEVWGGGNPKKTPTPPQGLVLGRDYVGWCLGGRGGGNQRTRRGGGKKKKAEMTV